jgi:hypothetical protein
MVFIISPASGSAGFPIRICATYDYWPEWQISPEAAYANLWIKLIKLESGNGDRFEATKSG